MIGAPPRAAQERRTLPPCEHEGYHWEPVVDGDNRWRLVTSERRCRRMTGHKSCGRPAVAELNRGRWRPAGHGRVDAWWAYCADHLYDRWIEDGKVMGWRLVKDAQPSQETR
jgi:hypothetical protein